MKGFKDKGKGIVLFKGVVDTLSPHYHRGVQKTSPHIQTALLIGPCRGTQPVERGNIPINAKKKESAGTRGYAKAEHAEDDLP